ncbi:hypothetical protein O0L34_g5247 [Tuta absoluta]|nr:hypothetical protein O0L34_g5247 [Tuta absoluta]
MSHVTRTASWLPPAESWPSSRDGSSSSQDLDELDDLPYGWEQALDSRGKPYYINHVNKTTTYVAPEGCSCESPPAPRDVVLDRDPELGFGFVAGSERPVLVRFVTDNSPSVGKLEPGDQILCVNGEDVSCSAREHVIAAVRACTERVTLRVCQPARTGNPTRRSALLSAAKRARLRARPPRVRFADSVQLNGAPMYPPSAFSLGDLCLPPMANVLKVFLENGQTKSFKYDTTTTVADVVTSLKDKLQIAAEEHFSLVVEHVKSVRRNKLTLLDPKESLARIAARPGSHKMRCLYRVVFMPSSAAELAQRDLNALDYLYMQSCNDVAQERFAPELQPDVALRLAALHMHQHALANNFSPAKLTAKAVEREFGLERFVPCSLLESMKRKELHRLIAHFLKLNSQMTGSQRHLTQLQPETPHSATGKPTSCPLLDVALAAGEYETEEAASTDLTLPQTQLTDDRQPEASYSATGKPTACPLLDVALAAGEYEKEGATPTDRTLPQTQLTDDRQPKAPHAATGKPTSCPLLDVGLAAGEYEKEEAPSTDLTLPQTQLTDDRQPKAPHAATGKPTSCPLLDICLAAGEYETERAPPTDLTLPQTQLADDRQPEAPHSATGNPTSCPLLDKGLAAGEYETEGATPTDRTLPQTQLADDRQPETPHSATGKLPYIMSTSSNAKLHYLDIVAGLPSYGAKCFSSTRPERVLLVSPRFGLSQIVGRGNSVPQPIASLEEVEAIRVKRECDGTADVAIFLQRHGVLGLMMDERDAAEMPLVIAGYYRLATGQDLNVETEREPITEDIAPPYLSQHCVVPAKWSYLHHNHPEILTKKHFAIFTMPPPYHATNEQKALDTNMNSNISNKNHSNNSSPLIGYDSKPGLLGLDVHFEKCKRNEEFRLFDNDPCYLDDGMGFDLQSVLSMELLENAANPRLVEAKNEEVLRRVAEMQKLVENSEQYLTENCDAYAEDYNGMLRDELVGRETCVDPPESDTESNTSRMSTVDDAPGILKHSDSLLLLTETINQGLNGLSIPETEKDSNGLTNRQSQGLSAILNNCGLTDALLALNTDLESDNDSSYTPTNSPIRKHLQKSTNNKIARTSFGLHSPDATIDNKESNLREYLKQLREKSSKEEETRAVEFCQESIVDNDAELIDLTLIPPPQTPDELDSATQVPQILPVVPPSFADERANSQENLTQAPKKNDLEEFIANVTVQPPTVKVTPAIELTPEEIMSYIIPPPPPGSNTSTLDREQVSYVNQSQILEAKKELQNKTDTKPANGDVVKGTLSVSEIRNMFAAKSLSDARNSLLLREKSKTQPKDKSESPKGKRKSVTDRQSNGNAHVIEYPTVERKSMFSCCSKDKNKSDDSNDESEKIESRMPNSDSIPDVCEIRPPPRRKLGENKKPPERPPKTPPTPAPRPRSNSFTCVNNELSTVEIPNNHFSTLNNRKLNYKVVCDINEEHHTSYSPPSLPPRLENRVLSPPPPILLPPKKPPLPPVPSIEVLRMKTSQKQSPIRNPEQRLASIGSPHFQRNLNTYRNLEIENRLEEEPPIIRSTHNYSSMTLQNRHTRSNSETKNTILKNKEISPALSLCSPQMNRRFSNRPDILNGAPGHDQRVFSPPLSERRAFNRDSSSPVPKVNHVRFKDDVVDDIPTPPSPPTVKFPEFQGNNGHVSIENLLCKTEVAVDGLLQRLHQAAQKCSHQHAHGGGEDIDEAKFQRARSELTSCAVSLVGASRTLVGALGSGKGSNAASALADCLAPLRRLSDLAQALGRHTSAPLQTRNLVLRVHDVTAAFKDLAGAEMAQIIHEHNAKKSQNQDTDSTLEGQLALRAECLANVLATLLRSLRVFSP